jgi:hypothetical protein
MGRADVLTGADRVQTHFDDPGVVPAEAGEGNFKRTRRPPHCGCRHSHDAHRRYRPGSDCALCECPRWTPRNPLPQVAGAVPALGLASQAGRLFPEGWLSVADGSRMAQTAQDGRRAVRQPPTQGETVPQPMSSRRRI